MHDYSDQSSLGNSTPNTTIELNRDLGVAVKSTVAKAWHKSCYNEAGETQESPMISPDGMECGLPDSELHCWYLTGNELLFW